MSTTTTPTLAEFLSDRIAEDEDGRARNLRDFGEALRTQGFSVGDYLAAESARILAECEARRRIVAIHCRAADADAAYAERWQRDACYGCNWGGPCDDFHVDHVNDCPTLRALALPYADHPDFRAEWRDAST